MTKTFQILNFMNKTFKTQLLPQNYAQGAIPTKDARTGPILLAARCGRDSSIKTRLHCPKKNISECAIGEVLGSKTMKGWCLSGKF